MKVYLIKDDSVSKNLFTEVFDLLKSINGKIQFICDELSLIDFNSIEYIELEDELAIKEFEKKAKDNIDDLKNIDYYLTMKKYYDKNKPKNGDWGFFLNRIMDAGIQNNKNKTKATKVNKITNWQTIFDKCNEYRINFNVDENSFVILLTEMNNINNWFSCLDEEMPFNGFIHTKDWKFYLKCKDSFPIAYQVIELVVQKFIYYHYKDITKLQHKNPIGCISDFCEHKRDIILKLRTADICFECMNIIKEKLPFTIIKHALDIMESLRKKMLFSQNFMQLTPLSKLVIDKNKNIHLPDFENIQIKPNPLEKTLYMLYLFHPEGIKITSLCDYKTEMYHIYTHISKSGDINEMKSRIDDLANVTTGSASQKISKIKNIFENAIGTELAKNYIIKGENSEVRKIDIDRKLVEVAD